MESAHKLPQDRSKTETRSAGSRSDPQLGGFRLTCNEFGKVLSAEGSSLKETRARRQDPEIIKGLSYLLITPSAARSRRYNYPLAGHLCARTGRCVRRLCLAWNED